VALDFLGALGSAGSALGGIGAGASAIYGLFGGGKQKLPAEAVEAQRLQSSLMRGLTGGNSPEFNNMVGAEANNSRTALLKAVNEIVRQNRRAMTRGPAGVLTNPDRRDESISRALMGVYENENDRARAAAKQTALGVLGQAGGVANNALRADEYGRVSGAQRTAGRATAFQAAGSGISRGANDFQNIMSALGGGAPSTSINDTRPRAYNPQSGMFGGA
jgi:hypothetical protein